MPFKAFIFNIMKFITANLHHYFELKYLSSIKNNGQFITLNDYRLAHKPK